MSGKIDFGSNAIILSKEAMPAYAGGRDGDVITVDVGRGREADSAYPGATVAPGKFKVDDELYPATQATSSYIAPRVLTSEQIWQAYRQSPDVRAAVDAVVRVISTWDWRIMPVSDPKSSIYAEEVELAKELRERLELRPNRNKETWQDLMSKVVRDVLLFDTLAMEKVFASDGSLDQLLSIAGDTTVPLVDPRQRLFGYQQRALVGMYGGDSFVNLSTEQILWMVLHPNSWHPLGTPIIETILTEIITMLRASENLMITYAADEIGYGLLMISGMNAKAGRKAAEEMRNMKGDSSKLRVLTSGHAQGADARWIQFQRSLKDNELKDAIKDVRRAIWRGFGVKPITMGDTEAMPRATAQAQLSAEDSGLIRPILELLQAKLNAEVMPLLIPAGFGGSVRFEFELERALTPDEKNKLSQTMATQFDRGAISVNEWRKVLGLPPIDGGDTHYMKNANWYVNLERQDEIAEKALLGEAGVEDDADTSPEEEAEDGAEESEDPEAAERRIPAIRRKPDNWQPGSEFSGLRTVDLDSLGDAVLSYTDVVSGYWRSARIDALNAAMNAAMRGGDVGEITQAATGSLSDLATDWSLGTLGLYSDAARIGHRSQAKYTGIPQYTEDWASRAVLYHSEAMGYMERDLIAAVRADIVRDISRAVGRSRSRLPANANPEIYRNSDAADAVNAVEQAFDRHEHRIENWSGKLVALAMLVMASGMRQDSQQRQFGAGVEDDEGFLIDDGSGEGRSRDRWLAQWVATGDDRTCPDCMYQYSLGYQEADELATMPGEDTRCGARCRCVLVWWLASEIDSGEAKLLGKGAVKHLRLLHPRWNARTCYHKHEHSCGRSCKG